MTDRVVGSNAGNGPATTETTGGLRRRTETIYAASTTYIPILVEFDVSVWNRKATYAIAKVTKYLEVKQYNRRYLIATRYDLKHEIRAGKLVVYGTAPIGSLITITYRTGSHRSASEFWTKVFIVAADGLRELKLPSRQTMVQVEAYFLTRSIYQSNYDPTFWLTAILVENSLLSLK